MGIVVDIGEVKRHIKQKADSTLYNMRKSDLIEYIRTLEHNYNVGATFLENQAKYIESLSVVEVVRCKDCKYGIWDKEEQLWECVVGADVTGDADTYATFHEYNEAEHFCSYGERRF